MRRYADTFFRYWVIAIVPILVLPLAAVYMSRHSAATAQINAAIWVNPATDKELSYADPNVPPAQNAQVALTQLLQSQSFDLLVAHASRRYWAALPPKLSANQIMQAVQADLSKNVVIGQVGPDRVTITYTTNDPQRGLEIVRNLLKFAPTEIQRLNQRQVSAVAPAYQGQLKYAQLRLSEAATALRRYMLAHNIQASQVTVESLIDPTFATLYQAMQAMQTNVQMVQQQLSDVTFQGSTQVAFQVQDTPSALLLPPSKKKAIMNIGIALVVALLLSGGFVVTKTALDRSVRSSDEVLDLIGLPVLAVVPYNCALATMDRRRMLPGASVGQQNRP